MSQPTVIIGDPTGSVTRYLDLNGLPPSIHLIPLKATVSVFSLSSLVGVGATTMLEVRILTQLQGYCCRSMHHLSASDAVQAAPRLAVCVVPMCLFAMPAIAGTGHDECMITCSMHCLRRRVHAFFMTLQVIAGAAPHPVSVVCGAALRRAGLVTASNCPESADSTGLSAWGALGLPGADQVAAVNHSSSPDITYTPYLTGFVSSLWAFTGFR